MSRARGGKKRFGYLATAAEPAVQEQEKLAVGRAARDDEEEGGKGLEGGIGEEGRDDTRQGPRARRKPTASELTSVPKGKGRMKQERSQLNVRIPTTLKRQASAKAVLEGEDIGGVVERLLRDYLDK